MKTPSANANGVFLAWLEGFEPATFWFVDKYNINNHGRF